MPDNTDVFERVAPGDYVEIRALSRDVSGVCTMVNVSREPYYAMIRRSDGRMASVKAAEVLRIWIWRGGNG